MLVVVLCSAPNEFARLAQVISNNIHKINQNGQSNVIDCDYVVAILNLWHLLIICCYAVFALGQPVTMAQSLLFLSLCMSCVLASALNTMKVAVMLY